jgi:transposase
MKKYDFFLGVDVSKKTLDLALMKAENPEHPLFLQLPNNTAGYERLIRWITSQKLLINQGLIVLEHTGLYSLLPCMYLSKRAIDYCLIPGIVLKRSLGILRGKSDKGDACLLAKYGMLYKMEIFPNSIAKEALITLQMLFAQRRRMITALKGLQQIIKEARQMGLDMQAQALEHNQSASITALKTDIKGIEEQMLSIICEDEAMKKQYELMTSIPGIGMQVSVYLLIVTHSFSRFKDARSLACYCGVAPFPYQSGSSLRGKTKTHPLCNNELKSLLHMASLNAVRADKELKMYYERKKAAGKNSMCVLNAVRNKLLQRVMATIKRGTPFVPLALHLN